MVGREPRARTILDWVKKGGRSPVGRTTFVLWKFYDDDDPLLDFGLLGPVTLQSLEPVVENWSVQ